MGSSPNPVLNETTTVVEETEVALSRSGSRPRRFADREPLRRGDEVGRYVVLGEVGRGGMGVVLAAYDPELDRQVALKLVRVATRGSKQDEAARARLIREAQAMAKLAHPNVITVHDVGAAGDDVFIAMEFVDGGPITDWLAAKERPWADVVDAFVKAGEGLSAAHAEGIVHRDFKPDNVLVGSDGRVRVADFGLARRGEGLEEASRPMTDLRSSLTDSDPNVRLTRTGVALGTPAYMAPEQHLGTEIDQRTDQFAFCVSLWEALAGARPFSGDNPGSLAVAVLDGNREDPPRDTAVPGEVWDALCRGLAVDPAERFGSIDELLRLLRGATRTARGEGRRGGLLIGIGLGGVIAAAAVAVALRGGADSDGPAPCQGAADKMAGVWDDDVRARVAAAFEATERAFTQQTLTTVDAKLDQYRGDWVASHVAACEATRVTAEQSEEMLDRRMVCLDQRRGQMAALTDAFASADAGVVQEAPQLLRTLAPIDDCNDLARLQAGLAPPEPEQRDAVAAVRRALAEAQFGRAGLHHRGAIGRLDEILADAKTTGYLPVVAEVMYRRADLLYDAEGPSASIVAAREALVEATRAGHVSMEVASLLAVAWAEAQGRTNFDTAIATIEQAEARMEREGGFERRRLTAKLRRASINFLQKDFSGALEGFSLALEYAESTFGATSIEAADLQFNIGGTYYALGLHADAERRFREAVRVYSELLGPQHPEVAQCHANLASALFVQGKAAEARAEAQRAIDLYEADGGHTYLGLAYSTVGDTYVAEDDYEKALEAFEKAYALQADAFGEQHVGSAEELMNVADALHQLERFDDARTRYERALATLRALPDADQEMVLNSTLAIADLETTAGRFDDARGRMKEAYEIAESIQSVYADGLVETHYYDARLAKARGNTTAARTLLDKGLALTNDDTDRELRKALQSLAGDVGAQRGQR